jgi:hypothetical protein
VGESVERMWTAGRCCVESTRFRDFAFGFFFAWWGFGIANQNVTVAIYALVTKRQVLATITFQTLSRVRDRDKAR